MNRAFSLPLALALALVGCGPTPNLGPRAPHGGTILPLPEAGGSLEFVKKGSPGDDAKVVYIAYFYGSDDKPLAPSPSAASFTPALKGSKPLELKPSGDPDQSLGSEAIADPGEVDGTLMATIGGKPVSIPVKIR